MLKKRLALLVTLTVASVLMLAGCGHDAVTYRPAAFGENGHCYYVEDPLEVQALYQSGYCQRSWTPFLMPVYWHSMYYPYYSSPAYYTHYVPVATRTVFVQHETVYKTQHASDIKTASAKAKYRSSTGKVVTGNKVAPKQFGGGSRTNGGGSRTKTCGMSQGTGDLTLVMKGGGGGSRGGSSGGSRSSTTGGSRSGTRSGTRTKTGGC